MKLLMMNQFFWPDSSATSQQLTDLATGLAQRGHEVHVLCSRGGYAEVESSGDAPPVTIHRVASVPFARGRLGRILSYASFYPLALWKALTLPRMDVVVSLTTPPLLSVVGTAVKALRGSRHYIWEQDIYPDVAVNLGVIKEGGVLDRGMGLLADGSRRHADGLLSLGECMTERLARRGVPRQQIYQTENWSNAQAITPRPRPGDPDQLVLLYSGNLGLAHDLDTFTQAMDALRDEDHFRFLFVGGGSRRAELEQFTQDRSLQSVEMRGYVRRDLLSEGLAMGDIGVVLQNDNCSGLVVPSKVYGIMAAGRGVLFIGPADATPALTIERHGCGWRVASGDVDGLVRLLRHLAAHPEEVRAAGERARLALEQHYDLPIAVDRMARILEGGDPMAALTNSYAPRTAMPAAMSPQERTARERAA